jgi:cytidine deaminase
MPKITSSRLPNVPDVTPEQWQALAQAAWAARENARVLGSTMVGAAVLAASGAIYAGCNVEHQFRAHDVHAEVNALTSMVSAGDGHAIAIVIVSNRKRFTPCGGCLDWIFELGGPDTLVAYEAQSSSGRKTYRASELMPYYPH